MKEVGDNLIDRLKEYMVYSRNKKENEMQLIILVTPEMKPIPAGMNAHRFGPESVIDDNNRIIDGESYHISATKEVIKAWLSKFDGFWISNNPMLGNWNLMHVKQGDNNESDSL